MADLTANIQSKQNLKLCHPQKYYVRSICRILYILGLGDYWYEKSSNSFRYKFLYKVYVIVIHTYLIIIVIDQLLAILRSDLTAEENEDLRQSVIAHPTVYLKALICVLKRDRIRILLKQLLDDNRNVYSSLELDKASVKKAKFFCVSLMLGTYLTLFNATIDGVLVYIKEGIPIRTEIVYYPTNSDHGVVINIMRFFIHLDWWYMATIMIFIDSLAFCCLSFLQYKFKLLQDYVEYLRKRFLENSENLNYDALEKKFKRDFVVGIKLHEQTLRIAENVQCNLGSTYNMQFVQSFSLQSSERTLAFLISNMLSTATLMLMTGAYSMASGDITNEASMLSTYIFHCGWDLIRTDISFRALALVTLMRAQAPVFMTAFGILTLSYANFIVVLRASYSFFAVMY